MYPLNALTDLQSVRQTGTAPSFSPTTTPFLALSLFAPGAVGTVAFAKYVSPVYLTAERHIPVEGTRLGTPEVQGTDEILFNLILPAGPPPTSGWPVAIYAQGSGENKEGGPFLVAPTMAAHGIPTIAINAVGRGLGALSTLRLLRGTDPPISLPAGGRGIDTNGDGQIVSAEGSFALAPRGIIRDRDARLQTAADLMQLVRVIQVGVDVDGDGVADLDPSRIYYFGYSFGGNYGAVFLSAERNVRAGVLMAPGGPSLESSRLSPLGRASFLGAARRACAVAHQPRRSQLRRELAAPRPAAGDQHGAWGDGDPGSSSTTSNGSGRPATWCPTARIFVALRSMGSGRSR